MANNWYQRVRTDRVLRITLLLCVLVIVLGSVARIVALHQYPSILNRDEAALAYNAALLADSGKDEWQHAWPLQLKSFGDYKLGGYIYTLLPFFAIFGRSDAVVRYPAAFAGMALIPLIGVLSVQLSHRAWSKRVVGLSAVVLAAATPVLFFYARMAWEANLGLLWMVLSLVMMIGAVRTIGKKERGVLSAVSVISMILAVCTYNAPLLLLPFFLPLPWLLSSPKILAWRWMTLGYLAVFCVGVVSLLSVAAQKSGIALFSDSSVIAAYPQYRAQFPAVMHTVLGNWYVYIALLILTRVVASFSPHFLVWSGGSHPWHSILGRGHVYGSEYVLCVLGLLAAVYFLLKFWRQKRGVSIWQKITVHSNTYRRQWVVLYLTVISIVPAVITVDAPHATRSLFLFVMVVVIASLTIGWLWQQKLKTLYYGKVCILAFAVVFCVELLAYGRAYFIQWPAHYPPELLTGLEETIFYLEKNYPDQAIAVIDGGGYDYVLFAWYLQLSPDTFFSTIQRHQPDRIGLQYGYTVGRYRFIKSLDDRLPSEKTVLQQQGSTWNIQEF